MSFVSSAAKLWHLLSEDPPAFDPHHGFSCDTLGRRGHCSRCTGEFEDDDGTVYRLDAEPAEHDR